MGDGAELMGRLEEGTRLLVEGRHEEAQAAYEEVWQAAREAGDDYAACAAAHMLGTMEPTPPEEKLKWHLASLEMAGRVRDGRVNGWYASIYINLGHTCRLLNRPAEARAHYEAGLRTRELDDSPYSQAVRAEIEKALAELEL